MLVHLTLPKPKAVSSRRRVVSNNITTLCFATALILSACVTVLPRAGAQEVTVFISNIDELSNNQDRNQDLASDVLLSLGVNEVILDQPGNGLGGGELATAMIVASSPTEINSYQSRRTNQYSGIALQGVEDFDAFCDAIDYGRIVRRIDEQGLILVKVDRDKLDRDAIKRRARANGQSIVGRMLQPNTRHMGLVNGIGGTGNKISDLTTSDYKQGDRVDVSLGSVVVEATVESPPENGHVDVKVTSTRALVSAVKDRRLQTRLKRADSLTLRVTLERLTRAAEAVPKIQGQLRTWTDLTGRFSIEAKYAGMKENSVLLEKADGKTIGVPRSKLSESDQEHIDQLLVGGAAIAADNPFAVASAEGTTAPPVKNRVVDLRADRSECRNVKYKTDSEWNYQPKPISIPSFSSKFKSVELQRLPESDPFLEKVELLEVSPAGEKAVVVRRQGAVLGDKRRYFQVIDPSTGAAGSLIPAPQKSVVLDILSEEGLLLLRTDNFGHGNNKRLFLQKIAGDELQPVASWEPHADEFHADVSGAWFLDKQRVLTRTEHSKRWTIWDRNTAKASYDIPMGDEAHKAKHALSADRRLLAIATDQGVALIDTNRGQHVGTLKSRRLEEMSGVFSHLAFSPDGRQLALKTTDGIVVWDLRTGEITRQFVPSEGGYSDTLAWTDEEHLLLGDSLLYDVPRRLLLWHYKTGGFGGDAKTAYAAGHMWFVPKPDDGWESYLGIVQIPHAKALEVADSLGTPEDVLVLKPGTEVSVEVDVTAGELTPAAVGEAVRENLTKAGFKVVEGASAVAVATCKLLPQQDIRINMSRHQIDPDAWDIVTRTITPSISRLEIRRNGQELWAVGSLAEPGQTIWIRGGETLDEALERITKPYPQLLTETPFDSHVARRGTVGRQNAYGQSRLTPAGVVD